MEPPASTGKNLTDYIYKNLYEISEKICIYKICVAIYKLLSEQVPKLNNIPSKILKVIIDIIISQINLVFNACFKIRYYLYYFKKLITVVLRKSNKNDYIKAKSYCPMLLLNTLGKVLKAILAKHLSYLAIKHILLPYMYMGG